MNRKFEVIQFRAKHVRQIQPDASPEMIELAEWGEIGGRGFTACISGNPIGAAGIVVHREGMGEAWALFSPVIKRFPKSLFIAVKKGLEEIIEERQDLITLVSIVQGDDRQAVNFLKHLLFEPNGKVIYERRLRDNGSMR